MDGLEPFHRHGQPADHGLPGNIQMMPGPPDLFLTVKRQVVAIFSDDDGRQQAGRRHAALLQKMKRGDDRSLERMIAPDIFTADQAAAQKPCGLIVQLLGHFLAHAPPGGGIGFDFVRIHDGFHCRKMFRQAWFARAALSGAAVGGDRFFQFSLQGGGIRAGGGGFFCLPVPSLQ